MKRTPLGRGKPLARGTTPLRRTPLARGVPLARGGPLPAESPRRRAERNTRRDVREATLTAAGHRCQAADVVPEITCSGPLDVDEITPRGVRPGAHLDLTQTQVLCRRHHDWKTAHPVEAQAAGLRLWSWETPT